MSCITSIDEITDADISNFKKVMKYLQTCEELGENSMYEKTIISHLVFSGNFTWEKAERMIIAMQRRAIIWNPIAHHYRLVN